MNQQIDLTFDHDYEVEVLDDLPSGVIQVKYYSYSEASKMGLGGLIVKIKPLTCSSWVGVFSQGYPSPVAISCVISWLDRHHACVVSSGAGYIVNSEEPEDYQIVKSFPITDVHVIPTHSLVIFADFTKLIAYDAKGIVWETAQLTWDGLTIVEVTPDTVRGIAWDAPNNHEVEFIVDIHTGSHRGGSSPS